MSIDPYLVPPPYHPADKKVEALEKRVALMQVTISGILEALREAAVRIEIQDNEIAALKGEPR